MARPIRILLVEDSDDDAELLRVHLLNSGLRHELIRVSDEPGFRAASAGGGWDLVLSDFLLADTTGLEILRLLREVDADLPFILVSGVLEEGAAVEAMRRGAHDFLLKGNLSRLVPAINRGMKEAELRRDRRAVEAEIKLLHTAMGQTPDAAIITDPAGTIVYANPAAEAASGYGREELIGQNPRIFKSNQHDQAFYKTMWETLVHGDTWRGHIINQRKDGSRWDSETVISPVFDRDGKLENYLMTARDSTRERELQTLLEQPHRLETIGVLTSGIAHDFNNILMPVLGHAELALARPMGDPRVIHDLEVILASARRAANLIRQILTFSRPGASEAAPLEFQALLGESIKLLRATVPTYISFEVALEARDCWVVGDPTKLHQVILNLCVNATHAMRGRAGRLTVRLHPEQLGPTTCGMGVALPAGEYLRLEVRDTGRGIPPEHLDKIFLPFFTTKSAREGTGLGLSVTHAIVVAMGGGIQVASQLEHGTVFSVFLSVVAPVEKQLLVPEVTPLHGTAHVVVVDDEVELLRGVRAGLEQMGFRVTAFDQPDEAIAYFRTTRETHDLLLTDFQMPGMTGSQLATAVWATCPDLPIILITGNPLLAEEGEEGLEAFSAVLYKPVSIAEITRAIFTALAGPDAARSTELGS